MARPVRGQPTPWPPEGAEEPDINPQQEEQPDATEGNVVADYNLDVDYEGSEPKNEPVTQEEVEKNSNAEYAKMEVLQDGTFCQRMMPCMFCRGSSRYIENEDLRLWLCSF